MQVSKLVSVILPTEKSITSPMIASGASSGTPERVELIRAAHNSCMRHPQQFLWESVQTAAPLGHTDLQVPAVWLSLMHMLFMLSKKLPRTTLNRSNGCC